MKNDHKLEPTISSEATRKAVFGAALAILNEAYAADPAAMHALVVNRVPCNQKLADHPSVQVGTNNMVNKHVTRPAYVVGMMGVLNGVIEPLTGKRIALQFSDRGTKTGVAVMLGFSEYTGKPMPPVVTKLASKKRPLKRK